MATKPARKAFGRSLSDFPKLSKVERDLLDHCRRGVLLEIGDGTRPEKPSVANKIRPELIRFLMLGGDAENPVHEKGVQMWGAWIEGDLDLTSCKCKNKLAIINSTLNGALRMQDCALLLLNLQGSSVKGINADRATFAGSVFLRKNFETRGTVRFLGAKIGGDLNCRNGNFSPEKGDALNANGAKIRGDVLLDARFKSKGKVSLVGAQIGGVLSCRNASFEPPEGDALTADDAVIEGNVFLDDGFKATGEVRLLGAQIGGDLICRNASFEPKAGDALSADGALIKGSVFLDEDFRATAPLSFASAQIGEIIDEPDIWPKNSVLDGLTYKSFTGGSPTDAATRIKWLHKQPRAHLYEDFRPQPWEQLIKVLRNMGHKDDADKVAIAKQEQLYRAGKITGPNRIWHKLYGWFAGYGYRPTKTITWMVAVWFFAALFYQGASDLGLMGPTSAIVQTNAELHKACNKIEGDRQTRWTICEKLPQTYTTFNAYWYSLDLILPLVDIQQEKDWSPIVASQKGEVLYTGVMMRTVMQFEILFGWLASLLLVAVLGNLVKKD